MNPLAGWLTCPTCDAALEPEERRLACPAGHGFDLAKQGYVNLLGHAAPANADTPAMLDARARFLAAGHYAAITEATTAALAGCRRIVEVGAGTGHYLAAALEALPEARGLATDVSPAAARRAARCHPRAGAIVADTWAHLPLRDGTADAVLCVFAPRNMEEFRRVLSPGGRLVVVVPQTGHLAELRARHGLLDVASDKAAGLTRRPGWTLTAETSVVSRLDLSSGAVADLIAMGPNAFHGLPERVAPAMVTLAVSMLVLRPSV